MSKFNLISHEYIQEYWTIYEMNFIKLYEERNLVFLFLNFNPSLKFSLGIVRLDVDLGKSFPVTNLTSKHTEAETFRKAMCDTQGIFDVSPDSNNISLV